MPRPEPNFRILALIAASLALLLVGCDREGGSLWDDVRTPRPDATSSQTPSSRTKTPVLPTAMRTRAPTPTTLPTLRPGVEAEVFGAVTCLNARKTPSKSAEIVKCLVDGTTVYIEGGPVDAEGYRWWKLRGLGWAAENWLRPKPN